MTLRVHLTDATRADIGAILRWIEERSPAGAEAWYRAWLQVLETLQERAEAFSLAPESEDHPEPIRQILFKTKSGRPYRALFLIRDRDVLVLHVRGPGQDLLRADELM